MWTVRTEWQAKREDQVAALGLKYSIMLSGHPVYFLSWQAESLHFCLFTFCLLLAVFESYSEAALASVSVFCRVSQA